MDTQNAVVQLSRVEGPEAELDQMWSFVQSKSQQRWLWHAIDHETREVLADVLAPHHEQAFLKLKALLAPFGIQYFYVMLGVLMNVISTLIFILLAK